MNFLQKITGSVATEINVLDVTSGGCWLYFSIFLFIMISILVITTSMKSKRLKEQNKVILKLMETIKNMEAQI